MGFFSALKGQFRSVIEWENPSESTLFTQWTEDGDEIKNASKLIVNPGQGCVFVYRGEVKTVITKPGMINLKTDNVPFWTTVSKFMQAFESEHKVGIYFFKTTNILNQRWGTPSVIKYEDPKYKFPVGLRAFGNYSFKITSPESFFTSVVGSQANYTIDSFRDVMGSRVVQPLTDYLAECRFTYAEIDANREEIAEGLIGKMNPIFTGLGFEMTDFRVEGTSFDEDTMKRINRIADMSAEAQAAQAAGLNYAQMQQLDAMRDAARNEGGAAGMGMGMGAGMGFGNMMAGAMGGQMGMGQQAQQQQAPQQQAPAAEDPMAVLGKLKQLFEMDLISQEEFDTKKAEVLSRL